MFAYPLCEGRARSVARSCDTQAVSLFYLQTTYTEMGFELEIYVITKKQKTKKTITCMNSCYKCK